MKELRLEMQTRSECGLVPEGISYTDTTLVGHGRLHLNYKKTVGEQVIRIHIAIPYNTAKDPRTWSVFEDVVEKGFAENAHTF
jgi:hypothetical protein